MIHEEICTYEVCKLAKEKGFNCKVTHYYQASKHYCETPRRVELHSINWRLETDGCLNRYNRSSDDVVSAPTQSLLQRWLREEKGIHISVEYEWVEGIDDWTFWSYIKKINNAKVVDDAIKSGFNTYELALEDALKYALENLA